MLSVIMECHYAESRYAECCYAECHYAECRGGILVSFISGIIDR
jgi:hypothetical protein